jgi:glycosyltransferase involved in cell wall biosynthesis
MKNTNKTYIAIASRNDRGPLEHINAILKNQNSTFSFISNLSESDLRITKYCNFFPTNKSKYIDIQLDILRILFKNNFKGSILVRHSVGFIIPYIYLLIKFKRPILELNGFTAQDLKDRKKSLFLKLINYITELFILHFSKNIIIVHKNLQALYSKRYFLNNKKFIVINNGISELNIDPIKKKNSDVVTLGYLGSLAAREGVDILLEHFSKLDKTKFNF